MSETTQYEGEQIDARLENGHTTPPRAFSHVFSRRYRPLDKHELAHHDAIKDAAAHLYGLIEDVGQMRETSIAKTKLEEAVMWAVKGLTK